MRRGRTHPSSRARTGGGADADDDANVDIPYVDASTVVGEPRGTPEPVATRLLPVTYPGVLSDRKGHLTTYLYA